MRRFGVKTLIHEFAIQHDGHLCVLAGDFITIPITERAVTICGTITGFANHGVAGNPACCASPSKARMTSFVAAALSMPATTRREGAVRATSVLPRGAHGQKLNPARRLTSGGG